MSRVGAGPSAELLGSLGKFGAVHHVPPPRSPSLPAVPVKKFFLIGPCGRWEEIRFNSLLLPQHPRISPHSCLQRVVFFFVILPAVGCWGLGN